MFHYIRVLTFSSHYLLLFPLLHVVLFKKNTSVELYSVYYILGHVCGGGIVGVRYPSSSSSSYIV